MYITLPQSEQDWSAYYDLRWRVLRAPWRQPKGSERDELEQIAYHVMVKTATDRTIGVGRIHPASVEKWQIRYMAVEKNFRDQGIGKMLLLELERHARTQRATRIVLNARNSATAFYLKHDFKIFGEAPTLYGVIKHQCMQKILPA
ncbi:GNAT family N-acetyltransferase [Nitrosomonas marina]|uniref:Acetyltransferase (GNAT) domain-containing protein n=1 Tax=Nitrosomonas marina TaxID=917 RepID=A0A1H8CFH5_9PROT|nr:GNAT family N-acetyltransferase [Nitrosomonas marina]SEM93712.1 Acetyltransferase (GNAT) domain-containing protein [Nitrosomonas marina]